MRNFIGRVLIIVFTFNIILNVNIESVYAVGSEDIVQGFSTYMQENYNDSEEALKYANSLLGKEKVESNKKLKCAVYFEIMRNLRANGDYEGLMKVFQESEALFQETNLNLELFEVYGWVSTLSNIEYKDSTAIFYANKASEICLEIYDETKDNLYLQEAIAVRLFIANVAIQLGMSNEAETYFNKAMVDLDKIGDVDRADIYSNVAKYYIECNEFELSNQYLEKANVVLEAMEDNSVADITKNENMLLMINNNVQLGELNRADEILKDIDKDIFASNDKLSVLYGTIYAEYLSEIGDYDKAILSSKFAYDLANETEYYRISPDIINQLIKFYQFIGDDSRELEYRRERDRLNEKIRLLRGDSSASNLLYTYRVESVELKAKTALQEQKIDFTAKIVIFLTLLLIASFIVIILMIKNKKKSEKIKTISHGLMIDGLTNVYNKKYLQNRLKSGITSKEEFYIAILDLDDYKKVNDTYGHMFGDTALVKVAEKIKSLLPDNAFISRFGGEEFVIMYSKLKKESVLMNLEIIRESVEKIKWEYDTKITISIGVADSITSGEKVMEVADKMMYKAKQDGKN
ncbi:MAG: GGDEF domain-containing protein, partial [Clostridium sp.]